jgi:hypothetical protein
MEPAAIIEDDIRNPCRSLSSLSILSQDFPEECFLIPSRFVDSRIESSVLLEKSSVCESRVVLLNVFAVGKFLRPVFTDISITSFAVRYWGAQEFSRYAPGLRQVLITYA